MKQLILLPLLFFVFLAPVRAQTNFASSPKFNPQQLKQDLDSLYFQLQQNHPCLFAHFEKKKADAAFLALHKSIKHAMPKQEFLKLVAPFVARFLDGHTYVSVGLDSKELIDYNNNGGTLFPLQVLFVKNKLYCSYNGSKENLIEEGDEITSINGKSAKSIIQSISHFWSGDEERTQTLVAQRLFGATLWTVFGWGTSSQVSFIHNGKKYLQEINGITRQEYLNILFHLYPARSLHLYPDYSLAVIEINEYTQPEKARAFIDSCFSIIQKENIEYVALDLRRNGGGNSEIGDYLLAHITSHPYATIRSKKWRIGPVMRSLNSGNWHYPGVDEAMAKWPKTDSDTYQIDIEPDQPASLEHPELFKPVKFYLITSGRTFSSAHMTALAVKCGKIGTIIGQPTGERLDLTGEAIPFYLPNTKLGIYVATASYKSACGNGDQVGVMPDYLVPIRADDLRKKRDPELELLKTIIKNPLSGE